jgi:hypothetical protein
VPETLASCEMASIKRVQAPRLALLQGRGGVSLSCSHTPSLFAEWLREYLLYHSLHSRDPQT